MKTWFCHRALISTPPNTFGMNWNPDDDPGLLTCQWMDGCMDGWTGGIHTLFLFLFFNYMRVHISSGNQSSRTAPAAEFQQPFIELSAPSWSHEHVQYKRSTAVSDSGLAYVRRVSTQCHFRVPRVFWFWFFPSIHLLFITGLGCSTHTISFMPDWYLEGMKEKEVRDSPGGLKIFAIPAGAKTGKSSSITFHTKAGRCLFYFILINFPIQPFWCICQMIPHLQKLISSFHLVWDTPPS